MEIDDETSPAVEFHRFMDIPDHCQEHVMSFLDFPTKMGISQTCRHLEKLMFKSPKLTKHFWWRIGSYNINSIYSDSYELKEQFRSMTKTKRSIFNIQLIHVSYKSETKMLLLNLFKAFGAKIKTLNISLRVYELQFLAQLLRCVPNVEKLVIGGMFGLFSSREIEWTKVDNKGLLPNLKDFRIDFVDSMLLRLFEGVTTLRQFVFRSQDTSYGTENFENFLLKQHDLKILEIAGMKSLFPCARLPEIKFQLESLSALCFCVHRASAVEFFQAQKQLKRLMLLSFYDAGEVPDRVEYSNIIRGILQLPQFELLTIGGGKRTVQDEDFNYLSDIRNHSVKQLDYWGDLDNCSTIEKLIEIFPAVDAINIATMILNLKHIPIAKIRNLNMFSPLLLTHFSYQAPDVAAGREELEKILKEFFVRHRRIARLTIGCRSWIEKGVGLSPGFVASALDHLDELEHLTIYNPLDISKFVKTLINHKRATWNSVKLYTDAAGRKAVKGIDKHWLEVSIA